MKKDGRRFRYEATDRLGQGNLFSVFKAVDRTDNAVVVLKVLRPELAADQRLTGELLRCAEAAQELQHPHITRLLGTGQTQGTLYLVSEYVPGQNGEEVLAREAPMPPARALEVIGQVLDALDYVHQQGLTHGDLRPHNLIFGPKDKVKVHDFCLASAYPYAGPAQGQLLQRAVYYIAPEVGWGGQATPASDVYATGVILYRALTGALPFEGTSAAVVALKHSREPVPPPTNLNPEIPPALEEVLLHALGKEPAARHQSASHLARDLRTLQLKAGPRAAPKLGPQPPPLTPDEDQAWRQRVREERSAVVGNLVWTFAILCLIATALFGAYFFWVSTNPQEVAVPNVVGMPLSEAESVLAQAGLYLKQEREEYSRGVPAGSVLRMSPPAGRIVKEGRYIGVAVSRGAELVQVPDLREKTLTAATEILGNLGLRASKVGEEFHAGVAKGGVTAQSPRPEDRVPKGTVVQLMLSKGPEGASVAGEETAAQEETQTEGGVSSAELQAPEKEAQVRVEVPSGPARQEVRIIISDDDGERVVYQRDHHPGDTVDQAFVVRGRKARLRVYLAGTLIEDGPL